MLTSVLLPTDDMGTDADVDDEEGGGMDDVGGLVEALEGGRILTGDLLLAVEWLAITWAFSSNSWATSALSLSISSTLCSSVTPSMVSKNTGIIQLFLAVSERKGYQVQSLTLRYLILL